MSQVPGRLPAIEALARGIASVRANSELLLVQIATSVLVAASILLPLFYLLARLGLPFSLLASEDPEAIRAAAEGMNFDPSTILQLLGVGLLIALVAGTIAFIVYCFLHGGTLAVLAVSDAQAPPLRRLPLEVFRTFSWRGFLDGAARFGWRLFWLLNLYLMVFTLLFGLFAVVLGGALSLSGSDQFAAACAVTCGLALPFLFLSFVLWAGMQMSGAVLVVEDASVGRAFRHGIRLTGRRFGALLLLLLLFVVASVVVSLFFALAGLGVDLAMSSPSVARSALSGGLAVLQFLVSTVLSLVFLASLIALARGEKRLETNAG